MAILGVGTDILYMPRMISLLRRHAPYRLASHILSKSERESFITLFPTFDNQRLLSPNWTWVSTENTIKLDKDESNVVRWLSLRWVAKEAIFKAVYPHKRLAWDEVTITKIMGKPQVEFSASVVSELAIKNTHLSISHDGDYIIGVVTVEQ
ncbi:holo-[acyl-carrier-protein] synthase [Synchytrium microbalum]|uniref:Holo-[acyl-carrier-protein] synthase n=1 Tax=Synchytrium microbalum TaxID=1806994 RepID=A0A507C054_9FUNG|nr:holo-[acyl-carrier-protein] synthase [Synchytrium microbalum]TPX31434.1 holo-[acyl-carrier-protein] synthase [Synchytrium microbalum]